MKFASHLLHVSKRQLINYF